MHFIQHPTVGFLLIDYVQSRHVGGRRELGILGSILQHAPLPSFHHRNHTFFTPSSSLESHFYSGVLASSQTSLL